MDMHVGLPTPCSSLPWEAPVTEYARLAEHQRHVCALIADFRQTVARPRGRKDALRVLKHMLPYLEVYFAAIESVMDKISAAGAAPHRDDHRRILQELKSTLQRCSTSGAERPNAALVHALDELVMHEMTIRLRAPARTSSPSHVAAPLAA